MNDRYQIFVSSTYQDLHRQRRLIAEAIQVKGLHYELTLLGREAFLENQTVASMSG